MIGTLALLKKYQQIRSNTNINNCREPRQIVAWLKLNNPYPWKNITNDYVHGGDELVKAKTMFMVVTSS